MIQPGTRIGGYRVVDLVGGGGMGTVYRAVDDTTRQVVAIKVLSQVVPPPQAAHLAQRLQNEARVLATLDHPSIARLHGVLEANGWPCLVMEYVDGLTLAERLERWGPLPPAEATALFRGVVEAIAYVHAQHVLHRDIKANNIKVDSRGHVKLLDFGIAKSPETASLTVAHSLVGTPQYLSPEQIRGRVADERSDIWSLGVLFYEMLTARMPFAGNTAMELDEAVCRGGYRAAGELNPRVTPAQEAVIARCLKKTPSLRYGSAADLLQALDRIPERPPERATARPRRWPPVWAGQPGWRLVTVPVLALLLARGVSFFSGAQRVSSAPAPEGGQTRVEVLLKDGRATQVFRREVGSTREEPLGTASAAPLAFGARPGETFELVLRRPGSDPVVKTIRVAADAAQNHHEWYLEPD